MIRALLLSGLCLTGCGTVADLLPKDQDGGLQHVPGTYLDARVSPGHRAHLSLEGEKQLSCHDCHFIEDAGFTGNAVKSCAACHEKQQEHHHPFDGGVAMSCFSCHVFRSVGEQARIGKWGCARCHIYGEKGEGPPRIEVHVDKCEKCHRPHGTPFTSAADCGLCHEVTVSHGKGERSLPAETCMACHPHHSAAKVALQRCAGCHIGGPVPAKAQVKPGALFEKGHTGCSTCHVAHAFTASSAKGCSSCHANKPVLAPEKHVACITCHRPHEEHAAPKACESCHKTVHPQHPKSAEGQTCMGCHPPHAAQARTQVAVPCITCHAKEPFVGGVVHAAKVDGCRSCHKDPHAGKPARGPLCITCHEAQLSLVKTNKGHQNCDACHAGLPHGAPVEPKPCLSCHEKKQPPQKGHVEKLQCASCHQSHSAKVVKVCTDCHNKPDAPLPGLHKVAKHLECKKCHAPHTPEPGAGPQTCRSCHQNISAKSHPTPPQQCVSCHLFTPAP